jgi:cell wall-associated NlpC family hydrolase/nucleoid-associated protein YgaU
MERASHQDARQFGWVPDDSLTARHKLSSSHGVTVLHDDAELMNPWAETVALKPGDDEFAYWVPYSSDMPPTIVKRPQRVAPLTVSPKLKYPMMVALTVATISSGGVIQALSAPAKAAPAGSDGTGSFQPVDETLGGEEITAAPTGGGTTHSVQPGDTLKAIAAQYGVDLSSIVSANGIANPDLIYPGDQISIPDGSASFAATSTVSYTVQAGDTVRAIASAHGVTHTAIINYEANGITNPDLIYPGQVLTIPGGSTPVASVAPEQAPQPAPEPAPSVWYTVQSGDTLRGIANAHGVSESAIIGYGPNGISNPDLIYPGQELGIPGGAAPVVTTQTSEPAPQPEPEPQPAPQPAPDPQPAPQAQSNPEPQAQPAPAPAPASSGVGQQIVDLAMQFQGAPYVWGATGPNSFDCTGFTFYIVNQVIGGGFPRDMFSQNAYGTRVSSDNLQPGDIVFQQNTYQPGLSHAGIYIGNGKFINAANPSVGVVISDLWDGYWGPRYHSAVRIG